MQKLITLIESGDTEAAKQLIKDQLNEVEHLKFPQILSWSKWKAAVKDAGVNDAEIKDEDQGKNQGGAIVRSKKGSILAQYNDKTGGWVDPKAGQKLNESQIKEQKHFFSIKDGKSYFEIELSPSGFTTITVVGLSPDDEKTMSTIEIKKVDLKALLSFLQKDGLAKMALNEAVEGVVGTRIHGSSGIQCGPPQW